MSEKKNNLIELTANNLIQYIMNEKLEPGQKLPNEEKLCSTLGIGRSTLRESVKSLVSRNILTVKQGAGTFVSSGNGIPEDPLGLTFMPDKKRKAEDLIEIRFMLEPDICSMAAMNITEDEKIRLMNITRRHAELIEQNREYYLVDEEFHVFLAECSRNLVLKNLSKIIMASIRINIDVSQDQDRFESLRQHKAIADAVCRGDTTGAWAEMVDHINLIRKRIVSK